MKIQKLIEKLTCILSVEGDIEVYVDIPPVGVTDIYTPENVLVEKLLENPNVKVVVLS